MRSKYHDTRVGFKTIQQCFFQPLAFGDGSPLISSSFPRIGGIPMLLGDDPQRRPKDHQDHADTGSSIWDGAVALAKAKGHHGTRVTMAGDLPSGYLSELENGH